MVVVGFRVVVVLGTRIVGVGVVVGKFVVFGSGVEVFVEVL